MGKLKDVFHKADALFNRIVYEMPPEAKLLVWDRSPNQMRVDEVNRATNSPEVIDSVYYSNETGLWFAMYYPDIQAPEKVRILIGPYVNNPSRIWEFENDDSQRPKIETQPNQSDIRVWQARMLKNNKRFEGNQ